MACPFFVSLLLRNEISDGQNDVESGQTFSAAAATDYNDDDVWEVVMMRTAQENWWCRPDDRDITLCWPLEDRSLIRVKM